MLMGGHMHNIMGTKKVANWNGWTHVPGPCAQLSVCSTWKWEQQQLSFHPASSIHPLSLCTELNFGQAIWDKSELLLGTSWEHDGNTLGTRKKKQSNKRLKNKNQRTKFLSPSSKIGPQFHSEF
jgi:hypothetical protein